MKLRPYQGQGLIDIWNGWQTHDILFFVLATGGGKTVTFVDVIKSHLAMGLRVMLMAHREEIINQAEATLLESGVTDVGVIKADRIPRLNAMCQVASIQTLARRDLSMFAKPDLIVVDEAHHVTSDNSYGKVLKYWPQAKALLVSASPYRLDGTGFKEIAGKACRLILNKTMADLQDEAYLVPFKFYCCSLPDLRRVKVKAGDYVAEEAEEAMSMAPIVESYLEHARGKSCITFAISVHHSKKIVEQYLKAGISAEHIDAATPFIERKEIIERFRNKITLVLVNVGIATEGTDIPGVDVVQLARPSKSVALISQMIGRASRALKGVVDGEGAETVEQRKYRIANSSKPFALILDNAGCMIEHAELLAGAVNWEDHFNGTKGKKKEVIDEDIEILVYVAEDKDGNIQRIKNVKELEGMRLIEVTKEMLQKVVDTKSLKEFDRLLALGKRLPNVRKVGYFAITKYLEYCKTNRILVNEDCWDYLETRLVDEVDRHISSYETTVRATQGNRGVLSDAFSKEVLKLRANGLSKAQFKWMKRDYIAIKK